MSEDATMAPAVEAVKAPRTKRSTTYIRDDGAEMQEVAPHQFVNRTVLLRLAPARKAERAEEA